MDGLSDREAVTIGQNFLLTHPEGKNFILSSGYIQKGKDFKNKGYIFVKFMSKQFIPFTQNFEAQFGVCIDKNTGGVFYSGKTYVHIHSGPYDIGDYEEKVFTPAIIDNKFEEFQS